MGYRVYYDSYLLYDPVMTDYKLIKPKMTMELSKVGSFTFTIPKNHPNYNFIEIMKPLIRIYRDGVLKWKGRIYKMTSDFYGNLECKCEDCMGFLRDTLIAPFNFEGTAGDMFRYIVNEHNARASAEQQIIIGNVDAVTEVDRWQQNYQNALDTIIQHVTNYHAGYMRIRYNAQEEPIIDYISTINEVCLQHCTYSENLADYILDRNAEDFATVVVPLGGQMNEIDPESTDVTRLTIKDVNGGIDYLVNEDLASIYGYIYQYPSKTTHDMVHRPETLLLKGQEDLAKAVVYKKTVTVKMADLGFLDNSLDSPDVGENIIIDGVPQSLIVDDEMKATGSVTYLLRAMEVDLSDPAMTELTLGAEKESFIAKQNNAVANVNERVNYIESNYLTEARTIAQTEIENSTYIETKADEIVSNALQNYVTVNDFQTTTGEISTTVTQTADGLSVVQNDITTITNVLENGDTATYYREISGYIKAIAGNLVLGKSDSPIKLKLMNDKLFFFSGADSSVDYQNAFAYFDAGQLYVKDVHAVHQLNIGNYYFQPENNGSLSLVYNGV